MKIAFMGTPEFAAVSLKALLDADYDVSAVYCQPDKVNARGKKIIPGAVKALALERGLTLYQPETLKGSEPPKVDAIIAVAYGKLLPANWLTNVPAINVHASLLPKWRGAAPIQRAIMCGDAETGVCTMAIERELDAGAVYLSASTPIGADEYFAQLHDRLAAIGAELLLETLRTMPEPVPQADGFTYAAPILKAERSIDPNAEADENYRRLRAIGPLNFELDGKTLKLHRAHIENGVLTPDAVQAPGGKVISFADYKRGQHK
ncbi:MAG: methionyl-tRNA formyltransferase [Oscillospiraceae bacterium]|jgi:methionyl-tRNA formyltransferase|nr:methionyl-tRNA formyltransferase [Oscillospiraceae bacterium]